MTIFNRHPQDHVGLWFEQRRKLGVSDTIYWARYSPETDLINMCEFQHAHGDGMSIMKHMLSELGYAHVTIPLCKEKRLPTNAQLKRIQKNIQPYPKKVKWLFWNPDKQLAQNSLETLLFSKQETKLIEQRAKLLNVPVTTLLLWALNRSASKNLLQKQQEYTWFYPVNLRGAVDYGTDYANYSSGFYLPVNGEISIGELQQRIRNKLKSGEHWFNWQQAKIAKYLPGIAIRWLYQFISKRHYYAGNFSAMGNWFSEDSVVSRPTKPANDIAKERWFCCAPGTKNYPISSCVMTWNDQLSLTLKLHSSIVKDENSIFETLRDWGENLLDGLSISLEEAKQQKRIISYSYSDQINNIKNEY